MGVNHMNDPHPNLPPSQGEGRVNQALFRTSIVCIDLDLIYTMTGEN